MEKVLWLIKHVNVVCGVSCGDVSLDNAPRLGRPLEVESDQTGSIIENNQHYTTREIADILEIFKSIKLLVTVKNVYFILQRKTIRTFWPTQYCSYNESGNYVLNSQLWHDLCLKRKSPLGNYISNSYMYDASIIQSRLSTIQNGLRDNLLLRNNHFPLGSCWWNFYHPSNVAWENELLPLIKKLLLL